MLQSSSSEKKLVKPFKNCFLDPSCTEMGSLWATPTMENFFLAEITKADHLLPESFYFIKISYVLTEFWICSILSGVFCQVWLDLTLINQSINQNKYISLPNNKNTSIVTTVLQWISIYTAAINYHINLKSSSVHLYNSTI